MNYNKSSSNLVRFSNQSEVLAAFTSGRVGIVDASILCDVNTLVDFKSEKKPDINSHKDKEKINRYRRQLEVYAHIVEQRTGLKVSKTHLYYTSVDDGNPFITFEVDSKLISATIQTFDEVVNLIEKKDFQIKERPIKLCKECDFQSYCDKKNWEFKE